MGKENKRILEEDGLLAEETKQPLPEFPRRIGTDKRRQRRPQGCRHESPQSSPRRRYRHPAYDRAGRQRDAVDDGGDQRTR